MKRLQFGRSVERRDRSQELLYSFSVPLKWFYQRFRVTRKLEVQYKRILIYYTTVVKKQQISCPVNVSQFGVTEKLCKNHLILIPFRHPFRLCQRSPTRCNDPSSTHGHRPGVELFKSLIKNTVSASPLVRSPLTEYDWFKCPLVD